MCDADLMATTPQPDHDPEHAACDSLEASLVNLLRDLVDGEVCQYDHHGYCQAHSLLPEPCPQQRARAVIARFDL